MQTETITRTPGESLRVDLGYSWVWTYGHLVVGAPFLGAAAVAWLAGAPVWSLVLLLAPVAWALSGFWIMRFVVNMNAVGKLPVQQFLAEDAGQVLDIGCGAGRASIIIGKARPNVRITAVDNFSAPYIKDHGEAKTARNFRAAGIADRVSIQTGDMLQLPFEDASFDGAISSHAIDHLGAKTPLALAEAARVLRADGQFLLMVSVPTVRMAIAFGPMFLLGMGRLNSRGAWRQMLTGSGFTLTAEGSSRGSAWFLSRRQASRA